MTGLEHIEIQNRRVFHGIAGGVRRMNRHGMMEGIHTVHILSNFGPAAFLQGRVLLLGGRKIVGHASLSCQAPHHWIGAPASYQVAPMLFHLFHSHER